MRSQIIDNEDDDPLAKLIAPPSGETRQERRVRLVRETEARRRSDAIDEELEKQRLPKDGEANVFGYFYLVRAKLVGDFPLRGLLVVNHTEGKTTTLKNFQLIHSPKEFHRERGRWRPVIQLNITQCIRLILEAMIESQAPKELSSGSPRVSHNCPVLSPELLRLRIRLLPLLQVEEELSRSLEAPEESSEFEPKSTHSPTAVTPVFEETTETKKFPVTSTSQWGKAFSRLPPTAETTPGTDAGETDGPTDASIILHACTKDMTQLWNDPAIRALLEARGQWPEDMGGFFLDSLVRVTSFQYIPTNEDILRARLKTRRISEYRFAVTTGSLCGYDWHIYDVGGTRSMAWIPYLDDVDAIIFLVPVSAFNQVLEEDPRVNCLEDSLSLWTTVVSNPLLRNSSMVLFLNKIDILRAKLERGIQFNRYVVSYRDPSNNVEDVTSYIKKKFREYGGVGWYHVLLTLWKTYMQSKNIESTQETQDRATAIR